MIFDKNILSTALNHVYSINVGLNDEERGSRWFNALQKAQIELEKNDTLVFEDGVLIFFSRNSGKRRMVTENGCSTECDCGGGISYHFGLFKIISHYRELEAKARKVVYETGLMRKCYERNAEGVLELVSELCGKIPIWHKPNPRIGNPFLDGRAA